jgi:ABC-type antimicrobial peptide transport system permease subunit
VAIVSTRVAQALFGRDDVVGRTLIVRAPKYERADRIAAGAEAHEHSVLVVGVSSDPVGVGQGRGMVLLPYAQYFLPGGVFAVRASGDAGPAAALLSSAIRRAVPDAGVIESGSAAELALPAALGIRTTATISGHLGALTVFLTSLGFYGILAQLVSARTREIALRVSLGASQLAVRLLVAREAVMPMVAGGILGFAIARVLSILLGFFYVRPEAHLDVRLALATMVVLATIALAACWIPMRRALRIDVVRALHEP